MSLEIQGVVIRGLRGGTQKNRTKADGEIVHVHLVLLAVGRDFLQMVQHQSHGFLRDKIQVMKTQVSKSEPVACPKRI